MELDSPPPPQTVPYQPRNGLYRGVPGEGDGGGGIEGMRHKEDWDTNLGGDDPTKSLKRTRPTDLVASPTAVPDNGQPANKRSRFDRVEVERACISSNIMDVVSPTTQLVLTHGARIDDGSMNDAYSRISGFRRDGDIVSLTDDKTKNTYKFPTGTDDRTNNRCQESEAIDLVVTPDSSRCGADLVQRHVADLTKGSTERAAVNERQSVNYGQSCASQNTHLVDAEPSVEYNRESLAMVGTVDAAVVSGRQDQTFIINKFDGARRFDRLTNEISTELPLDVQPVNLVKHATDSTGISCFDSHGIFGDRVVQDTRRDLFCDSISSRLPDQVNYLTSKSRAAGDLIQPTDDTVGAAPPRQSSLSIDVDSTVALQANDSSQDVSTSMNVHLEETPTGMNPYTPSGDLALDDHHETSQDAADLRSKETPNKDDLEVCEKIEDVDEAAGEDDDEGGQLYKREKRQSARVAAIKLTSRGTVEERKRRKAEEQEEKRRKKEEQLLKKKQRAEEMAEKRKKREEDKIRKAAEMEEKKRRRAIELEEKQRRKEAKIEERKRRQEELQERLRRKEEEKELQRRQQLEAKAQREAAGEDVGPKQRATNKRRKKATDTVPLVAIVDDVDEGEDGWKKNAGLTLEDRERIPLGPMSGVERVLSWLWGKHCVNADLPPYLAINDEPRDRPMSSNPAEPNQGTLQAE